ncbi:hypothetical protein [Nocardia sp. BMG51109]|uniref:hypothetical protein n=1 Tax=Nocardia sp. BMG51109 TaxID=1056816 RepID=UPI000466E1DC|nr:hypothetical protein [Nocardia sp. BMG51109]
MDDDPELAQARVFLAELEHHARMLSVRRGSAPPEARQPIDNELADVRRHIDRLYGRFADLRPASP